MTIFGKSRDLKTKTPKNSGSLRLSSMEQMPKGRVHSDAKTDVWVCCDLHYQKSNDVIKFL